MLERGNEGTDFIVCEEVMTMVTVDLRLLQSKKYTSCSFRFSRIPPKFTDLKVEMVEMKILSRSAHCSLSV